MCLSNLPSLSSSLVCSPFSDILPQLAVRTGYSILMEDCQYVNREYAVSPLLILQATAKLVKIRHDPVTSILPTLSWPNLKLHHTVNKVSAVWVTLIPYMQVYSLRTVTVWATESLTSSQRWLPHLLWTVSLLRKISANFNTWLLISRRKRSFYIFLFLLVVILSYSFLSYFFLNVEDLLEQ